MNERTPMTAERLVALADGYLLGELDADQLAELEYELKRSPASRTLFATVAGQATTMREVFGNATEQLIEVEDDQSDDFFSILSALDSAEETGPVDRTAEIARREMEAKEKRRNQLRLRSSRQDTPKQQLPIVISQPLAWLGIAAVLGLLASIVWFSPPVEDTPAVSPPPIVEQEDRTQPSHARRVQIATVIDALGARLPDGRPITPGTPLYRDEQLDLAQGVVQLELTSGVTLTVEGPAQLTPASDMYVALDHGKLVGRVSERGYGFTVHVHNADIIDLGTEFAIETTEQQTRVQVFEGEINVASPETAFSPRIMADGDAGVVLRDQVHQTPFDEFAFLREVPTAYELAVRDFAPLVWWSFSAADDGRLADRGHAGVHVGNATRWQVTEALNGEAFSIDGSQRPIGIPETGVFNLTNDFTIEAWVRVRFDVMPSSRIISTMPEDGGLSGFGFGFVGQKFAAEYQCLDADGRFFQCDPLSVKFSWFGMFDLVTQNPIPQGEWAQVVVVCSSDHPVRLYINGEPQRVGVVDGQDAAAVGANDTRLSRWLASTPGYASTQPPVIGSNAHDGEVEPLIGDLDELVFFDKPLTDEQVLALFESGLASGEAAGPGNGRSRNRGR